MAKKYISKTGGSYELTRSAKAYDADEKASEKERSGNGGKRQRVESKGKLNLSADAASIFSPDEIKTLEEKAGKTTVSTGGGDPLPPGSKDNEFIVAKNKEEAEKIREQVGEDVAVRLEQNRNPKTGEFAENNKKLGDESGNEKDQSENNEDDDKIERDAKSESEKPIDQFDPFEILGIDKKDAEKRAKRLGYTLEEFIAVFNRNLGNVEDLVKKKKELKKRLGILGKRIGGVKGSITRRFGKEGEDTFDLIDKLGKKLEEQSDSYDYKGKTDYTREQIVENYNKISKDFRNWLGLFSQEARRSDIVKEKYNKFLDKTFGGKVPEDFTVRQLGDYLAAQKQIANRQKNQQPQAVNKPEISKPEPVKKATEPMPNAKDNIIRQIATEVSYNPKKYEDNAKAILEQLGKVPEYKNKVKQWETDLKAGLAKGDPTSAIANIILEGREYNRKKKAAQNEEKDAMKLFQLDK